MRYLVRTSIPSGIAIVFSIALFFAGSVPGAAQNETDSAASRSKVLAFESAWGMAEKNQGRKGP